MKMTEKELRRRYDEIKSEKASIDVDEYELYASEIAEIRESL